MKERAYRKLKIEAAMQGANVVFLTQQLTTGNQMGTKYQAGKSTETNLDGVAYSNKIPKFEDFNAKIGGKSQFSIMTRMKLWSSGSDMDTDPLEGIFTITNVTNENGLIMIEGNNPKIRETKFRVAYLNDTRFILVYEDKSSIYNLVLYY